MSTTPTTRILTLGIVLLLVASAGATEGLTLAEAIAVAQQESNRLAVAEEAIILAREATRAARAAHMPELGISATHKRLDADVVLARLIRPGVPPERIDIGPFDSDSAAVVRLSQVLYAGGANRAGVRASLVERQLATSGRDQERLDLTCLVTGTYYTVLLAERRVEVEKENVRRSQEILETISALRQEQEALQADLLGAEAQLALDRQGLLEAESDLSIARSTLNRFLGRDMNSELQLAGTLQAARQTIDEERLMEQAVESSPDLQLAATRIDLADASLDRARAIRRPRLQLEALYSWFDNEVLMEGSSAGLAVNLSVPFCKDVAAAAGAVGQARARQRMAQHELSEATSQLRLAVRQAARRLQQAYGAIDTAAKNLEYHRERYRVTQRAFQEQLATFSDLLDDHAELAEADLAVSRAHYQARVAEAKLRRLTGQEK